MVIERLLNVNDVAGLLGVSIHTVYAWAARGQLPVVKVGTRTMFESREIQRWVRERSRPEATAVEGVLEQPPSKCAASSS